MTNSNESEAEENENTKRTSNAHAVFIVDGAEKFREFVKSVFDATTAYEDTAPDGTIGHCEARIGDSTIMFGGSGGPWTPRTSDLFIYVRDADEIYKKALEHGATTVLEPENKSYGRSAASRTHLEIFGGSRLLWRRSEYV